MASVLEECEDRQVMDSEIATVVECNKLLDEEAQAIISDMVGAVVMRAFRPEEKEEENQVIPSEECLGNEVQVVVGEVGVEEVALVEEEEN